MYSYPNILLFILFLYIPLAGQASGSLSENDIHDVKRAEITNSDDKKRIQKTAVLLAQYEIEAKKLIDFVENEISSELIQQQAAKLMDLSEHVIDGTKLRLPQCHDYLNQSLVLKNMLNSISHESLEKDYHLDGALPKAPGECYHTKDLFVHPATVIVLTRDDPALTVDTKTSIKNEITEVLAHTEIVRQLVIY